MIGVTDTLLSKEGIFKICFKKKVIVYLYVFLDIWMYDQIEDNVVVSMKFGSFVWIKGDVHGIIVRLANFFSQPKKDFKKCLQIQF